jgi:hypothetical protein
MKNAFQARLARHSQASHDGRSGLVVVVLDGHGGGLARDRLS